MRTTDRRSVKILNLSHNFTSAQGLSLKNDDLVSGKLVKFSNHSLASSCHFISSRGICWKKKEKVNSRYLVISTLCESYPCCLYFPYTRQLVNILNNKDVRKMKVFCFEPQTEFSSCRLHTQSCLRLFSEFKGVTKISWKQISHLKWSFLHKQIMSSFIRRTSVPVDRQSSENWISCVENFHATVNPNTSSEERQTKWESRDCQFSFFPQAFSHLRKHPIQTQAVLPKWWQKKRERRKKNEFFLISTRLNKDFVVSPHTFSTHLRPFKSERLQRLESGKTTNKTKKKCQILTDSSALPKNTA